MSQLNNTKKASHSDWHPADIVAALRKKGWSLRRLSIHHQLSPYTLGNAIASPYPKGERIIAAEIGVAPQEIWPSRYDDQGMPNRGRRPRSV
ncbi:helix-turn-helix transcriptional regulator [Methylobacter sp. Wu1]|uniref:helix-turn-helix domain-containing protein n=1 Tax=Methylobacter sp. Wu1 TaxID=3119359 RepID=UPI002F947156